MNPADASSSTERTEAVSGSSQQLYGTLTAREQYEVQHGLFKWSIENFSFSPSAKDKYISSPIFEMNKTSWTITLNPKSKICGEDKISLNLFRHRSDSGPEIVTVSYRLGLESHRNKVWFKHVESKIFGKGYCYGFQTSVLGHLEDFLVAVDENNTTLSVLCEIYVKYSSKVNIVLPRSRKSVIDSELPSNMVNLLTTENNSDVLIEIPKTRLKAHKSVLCARSKTLARMLEDDKSFLQFSCTLSCLKCVLLYMYSGSIDYFVVNSVFSIGLYELACELSLFQLRELLTPYKIELKSRISIEECKIACTLQDLQTTDFFEEDEESPVYFDRATGIGIKICRQQTNSLEYLEIRIKVSGILAALDFTFELCILNKNHEPFEMIPANILQNSEAVFENLIFTYSVRFSVFDIIKCCESDGNLYLIFACKRYSLTHLSNISVNSNKYSPIPLNDPNIWLEELSSNFKELFTSGYLSDITLSSFGKKIKAHRSVLAARSTYFNSLFRYDQHKNDDITIFHVVPSILEVMLTYVYSGTTGDLSGFDKIDFLELYEAAEQFQVKSLKDMCSRYLLLHLDPSCVYQVLSSAAIYGNSLLMSECKKFISNHQVADMISSDESEGDDS